MRTTLRMANKAAEDALQKASTKEKCLDALEVRADIIQSRWQLATIHIPEHLHEDLEQILHQPP